MRKKLVLHIGTEKTGTTTLQHFLQDNTEILLEDNVYVPQKLGALKGEFRGNHRKLATACMALGHTDDFHKSNNLNSREKIEQWNNTVLSEIVSELENIKHETTIISSEHFSSRLISKKEVNNLKKVLSPYFDDIEVVIYLRRQDKYAVSLYSTGIKNGLTERVILPDEMNEERYNYLKILDLWKSEFNNINVRIFEKKELVGEDLICDFLSILNLENSSKYKHPEKENPSLNDYAQDFLIIWNCLHPKYTESGIDNRHQELVKYLEKYHSGSPRLPMRKRVIWWMSRYKESNKKVALKYFNREYLFDDNYMCYPNEIKENNNEEKLVGISLELSQVLKNIGYQV